MRKMTLVSLCALALVLVMSPLALAETPQETANQSPVVQAPAELLTGQGLPADGLMAFIDPETGTFRQPTAQEAAAIRSVLGLGQGLRMQGTTPAPREHALAGGGAYALLDPSLHPALQVRRKADGTLEMGCTQNHDHSQDAAPATETAREEM